MGDARDLCPHLDSIGEVTKEDLLLKSKGTCQSCGVAGPNLWACLQDSLPPSHPLKAVPVAVADEGESESEDEDLKPRGLTGMKNLGNSCYMNAALQALSNCPPLTQFFLECGGLVRTDKKPALCKSYQKLVSEVWHKKRPSYVVPTSLSHGIKLVNPMFRGYAQQVPGARVPVESKAGPGPAGFPPLLLNRGPAVALRSVFCRFVISCTPSWFWGPVVTLEDCLAAFFAADELKGDNMYSCERCKKLRNGVKYCKVLQLPEILCVHLKRFRHEVTYSFKVSSHVSFPVEGLDLRPFLAKECASQITTYDLLSVICHHGTAGRHPPRHLRRPGLVYTPLNKAFQAEESPGVIHCVSMQWFREWEAFVKGKDSEPPGPIDNSRIAQVRGSGHVQLKPAARERGLHGSKSTAHTFQRETITTIMGYICYQLNSPVAMGESTSLPAR
ncbi:Ubiquitin carboxyl-terminal hydrolase 20 [Fukomys damarensis]|uniref:Ubiquitin carboxyl-terminal hydrolase 20 n=1 Tax=Fukomys damarensis TaxID=885580 RepID=A0A091E9P2_FUKDA|nr:Ubiquitin carboxyl-terminal hydrolase 20 [Fukomys damarensis]